MATKAKTKGITKASQKLLKAIADATTSNSVEYVDNRVQPLVDIGYVTVDENDADETGDLAATLTEAGAKYLGLIPGDVEEETEEDEVPDEVEASETPSEFKVRTDVSLSSIRKHSNRTLKYPFDKLSAPSVNEAGNTVFASFHVPKTAEKPEPNKSIGSSLANARKRYLVDGEKTRDFTSRTVGVDDPEGPGVRVFRIL